MKASIAALALAALVAASAAAQPAPALKPALAGLGFLAGDWKGRDGKVDDVPGGRSQGGSQITVESDGAALLRRDHTEVFDAHGKQINAFHQTMLIYPEGEALHADFADGEGHVIHYVSATVTPGRSVVFHGAVQPGAPTFRLSYELSAPDALTVDFGMIPPGATEVRRIATGTLRRVR